MLADTFSLSAQTGAVFVPRPQTVPDRNVSASRASSPTATPVLPKVASTAILPAGVPLRVQIGHRYRIRKGDAITGKLIDPVYLDDSIVLPANTIVTGTISNVERIHGETRTWALLDGDLTPLKRPALVFNMLRLPAGQYLPLTANATERTADVVNMSGPQHKESLIGKVRIQIDAKKQSVEDVLHSPHKSDLALKFLYGQLPYHPQNIWAGTQFDAVLGQPVVLPNPEAQKRLPVIPPQGHIPPGTLDARLVTTISSATDKVGNPIAAVLTQPYFNTTKTAVILPTGTQIMGLVTQAKPAGVFARKGTLQFPFRQFEWPGGRLENMHGQITSVEGTSGQNVTVDSEGGAKANSPQGKYLAPLLLGALASNSLDADQNAVHVGVSSNGFGLVTRIIAFVVVAPTMTATFAYYSLGKSIIRRWIMPGQNVVFAKNTRMKLSVSDR